MVFPLTTTARVDNEVPFNRYWLVKVLDEYITLSVIDRDCGTETALGDA